MISGFGELLTIGNKNVFITESHHCVLLAWAEYRKTKSKAPFLFSLDHHTDTHEPFWDYTYNPLSGRCDDKFAKELVSYINYNDDQTVLNAVGKLANDEHINAALESGIVDRAFIVSYSSNGDFPLSNEEESWINEGPFSKTERPLRPYTYKPASIYLIENLCAIGCPRGPHNDDCRIPHFNQAIESVFLDHKLSILNEMLPGIVIDGYIQGDYILDIDLDYFHTLQSINPQDANAFYKLIKNAGMITIAKESSWIDDWREIYDKNLNVTELLDRLLEHINKAQSYSI